VGRPGYFERIRKVSFVLPMRVPDDAAEHLVAKHECQPAEHLLLGDVLAGADRVSNSPCQPVVKRHCSPLSVAIRATDAHIVAQLQPPSPRARPNANSGEAMVKAILIGSGVVVALFVEEQAFVAKEIR
jgi:hypothetical protein